MVHTITNSVSIISYETMEKCRKKKKKTKKRHRSLFTKFNINACRSAVILRTAYERSMTMYVHVSYTYGDTQENR